MKTKHIVITGVGRGLGNALVDVWADAGHVVHGCTRLESAVASLASRFGSPHSFRAVDVSADEEVRLWSEHVLAEHEPPDLLVNNAALINGNAPLWGVPAAEFDGVIDVNIKGVANVIRHFLPAMIRRGIGVVVNFSSGWGRSVSPEVAPYCATKWAIEGLTQALAQELPSGMAAVPLNPGIIDTEMLRSCFGDSAGSYPGPTDWARRAAPFILSLSARHNGHPLTVPG